ncbi:glycosyl hydrolase family 71-domain-containing protein [Aspergillus karnatakaensis]|uniref:glycoside hydrolase family 71 protein n=1 Tax=Aspergillus karnatakaensis TaxID=1810916 RepID=UPI003CCD5A9B
MAPLQSLIILAAVTLVGAEVSSDCQASVHNDTIAFFSSAPITFSFDLDTMTDCQIWCTEVPKCQAWVYVDQSSQCDLYRAAPLSVSESFGFTFGGCAPTSVDRTQLALPSVTEPTGWSNKSTFNVVNIQKASERLSALRVTNLPMGLFAFLLLACRVQAAAVFAHFMVTNSANYTSDDWRNDMKLAQDAHIDAFALNMAYNDPTNMRALPAAFSAADSVGFKLFFSFDYAGNGKWPKNDVTNLIKQYSAHSSYYFYRGQAFVSTFEGPGSADDWNSIKFATGCFFIPSWSSLGAKPAVETDGLFSWAGWPWGPQDMDTYIDASYLEYLKSLPYMMPVSPWFFTNLSGYGYKKNWIWRGDDLWYDRWQESHYIGPLHDKAMEAFDIGKAPFNYVTDMPHDGWRNTLPFWIDMYKKGTAEVTREWIVAWYRLTPGAACGSGGTSGNTASQLQIEFPPSQIAQDRIFFSAVLASFSGVVVSIGGEAQTVAWTHVPDDDIGVYHGSVAFGGRTGPVTVSLLRDNEEIAIVKGKQISGSCANGIQNWNAWVGSQVVTSRYNPSDGNNPGDEVSARPKLLLSEQTCMNGTGANNFAGLCQFSCTYGYCPLGACTCTRMGLGYVQPNSTGVKGYPISGEGASYSGLCNFDCNLGYCPPSSCGTVEVPLVVPTVSPFLPPACTSGTGEGNLAGLCDFSCTHGYCPMNACTCTGQGAVNVMNPTTDVIGQAGPGQDPAIYGPLCEYTCQRGYCPEGACMPKTEDSSDDGTGRGDGDGDGNTYIAPSIWQEDSPVVQCEPPCSLILPPLPLDSPSTIFIPPWTTPITQSHLTTRTTTDVYGITTTYLGYKMATTNITLSFPTSVITEISVWGISINASQTRPSVVEMTSSITLPGIIYVLPPFETGPTPTRITTTITPPPYPWTETGKDTAPNTRTTTWSPGTASPSATKGSKGTGRPCRPWCNHCLLCPPDWGISTPGGGGGTGGGGGGSGGGSSNGDPNETEDDECSTRTAQICSTACVEGSGCDFACSTTTGCSATPSSTTINGTPASGVVVTMEQWPQQTDDSQAVLRIASSLDKAANSKFGTQTMIKGILPTGTAPMNGPYAGGIIVYYFAPDEERDESGGSWSVHEYYNDGEANRDAGACLDTPGANYIKSDGAFRGMKDGVTLQAFGSTCTYRGSNLPAGHIDNAGRLVCDEYRDAQCRDTYSPLGTCHSWEESTEIMDCTW